MAKKTNIEQKISEMRGNDRVFQIDRDTFAVYTGQHSGDMRPFIRVGAGKTIPRGVLRHFENVLLTENDPLNVGLEAAWLHATLKEGEETIRYVGSKDRVAQIYGFTGMRDLEPSERHVEAVPYKATALESDRDRSTITFFETGNAVVQVGSTKTYDHSAQQRGRISIDREYDLLSRALRKRDRRCESGRSFMYMGEGSGGDPALAQRPPIYWNFEGRGLFLNPPADPHYTLFEHTIDPERVDMAVNYSPFGPGLGEILRRKNATESNVGYYQADETRNAVLKKIYREARLQPFGDSSALPMAKDTGFFVSKGGSHGVFNYRIGPQADRMVQLLFPMGGGKFSRGFDFIKAPHDLEIQCIHDKTNFAAAQGRITLQTAGNIGAARFDKERLSATATPLVPDREYHMVSGEDPAALADQVIGVFAATPLEEMVRGIVLLHLGLDFTGGNLNRLLEDLRRRPLTKDDVVEAYNLRQLLGYLQMLPAYRQSYDERQRKLLDRLMERYEPGKHFRYGDWAALSTAPIEFLLIFTPRRSFQFVRPTPMEPAQLRLPPPFETLERDPKAYARKLREWNRAADRAGESGGFRTSIETLERLYEEKLRLLADRKRFNGLLDDLGIKRGAAAASAEVPVGRWSKRRSWQPKAAVPGEAANGGTGRAGADSGFSMDPGLIGRIALAAGLVIALLALGVWFFAAPRSGSALSGGSGQSELSLRGDSAAEMRAVDLSGPGGLQSNEPVPGEDRIEAKNEEVFAYANLLAARNNFAPLNTAGGANRRDPNLVFPDDVLELPDGRRAGVEPGQYIWEIAAQHYRKDRARFLILDRQIATMLSENAGSLSAADWESIDERRDLMERLAATPEMQSMLADKDREIAVQRKL